MSRRAPSLAAVVLLVLMLVPVCASRVGAQVQPRFVVAKNDVGGIEFYATNYGIFGLNVEANKAGFFYPRGSDRNYLFGSGLWFGARKRVADTLTKLVFVTYNPNSGSSWASPGEYRDTATFAPLFYSRHHDRNTGAFLPSSGPIPNPKWPLWLPFGPADEVPMKPGVYEPDTGERRAGTVYRRPAFVDRTNEQFVTRFNDGDLLRYEAPGLNGAFPLRLQVQQNIYAWSSGTLGRTVVIQYEVVNRSSDTLFDCVMAQAIDPDIGVSDNDMQKFYTARPDLRVAFAWTETEIDKSFGALMMSLVEAPMTSSSGFVDNRLRSRYRADGRAGCFPEWTVVTDPQTSIQRYDFMTSGAFMLSRTAADQRSLLGSTTFHMMPGDTAYYAIAFAVLQDVSEIGRTQGGGAAVAGKVAPEAQVSSTELLETVAAILDWYYELPSASSVEPRVGGRSVGRSELAVQVAPNPVSSKARLSVTMPAPGSALLTLVDLYGSEIEARVLEDLEAGANDIQVDLADLPAGLYMVRVVSGASQVSAPLVLQR